MQYTLFSLCKINTFNSFRFVKTDAQFNLKDESFLGDLKDES